MDDRKSDVVAAHISNTSRHLRDLAEEARLPFLAHLLGMVILEAEKPRPDGR
jgi:hypothetical protein